MDSQFEGFAQFMFGLYYAPSVYDIESRMVVEQRDNPFLFGLDCCQRITQNDKGPAFVTNWFKFVSVHRLLLICL